MFFGIYFQTVSVTESLVSLFMRFLKIIFSILFQIINKTPLKITDFLMLTFNAPWVTLNVIAVYYFA